MKILEDCGCNSANFDHHIRRDTVNLVDISGLKLLSMRLDMDMVMSLMVMVVSESIVHSYNRKKRYRDAPAHLNVK